MNEMKSAGRTDKETNTECVFMHPNQSTVMRMRMQQQQQQQVKNDYLTVKRSKTFNTRTGQEGADDGSDYICRVSLFIPFKMHFLPLFILLITFNLLWHQVAHLCINSVLSVLMNQY
jgi:hypothetical protein